MESAASLGYTVVKMVEPYIDCEILVYFDSFAKDVDELHEIGKLPAVSDAL